MGQITDQSDYEVLEEEVCPHDLRVYRLNCVQLREVLCRKPVK
jgi:hypothetical protein